jgi:hypothetical protein
LPVKSTKLPVSRTASIRRHLAYLIVPDDKLPVLCQKKGFLYEKVPLIVVQTYSDLEIAAGETRL